MKEKHTCCGEAWDGYRFYNCGRTAKYEREGKWYCGIHDPVKVEEKRAAREARWSAEYDANRKKVEEVEKRNKRLESWEDLLAALEDSYPFVLCQAATHCESPNEEDFHPTHKDIIKKIRAAIDKARGHQ